MTNSTQFSHFRLALLNIGIFKYLSFMLVICFYISVVCTNVLLIVVICVNRSLHEPMYMFLCSLFVNALYGSTTLFPPLLLHIICDINIISASLCYLQIYCIHCYGSAEYLNLAVMSYDRYLAICFPLQYNTYMTPKRIAILIAITWLYAILACALMISLSSTLPLCGNIINKVYCDNYSVIKLACSDTKALNIYGIIIVLCTVCCPLMFMLYTYIKILRVCSSGSKQVRQKAVTTCSPHLACVLNFSCGACFEILQSRFNMSSVPILLRIFLSLYWLISQPLLNPLVYGLNMTKIRILCKNLLTLRTLN
ncbi:olfactory receptor 4C3D-like [Pelmatolapia mariae]|uniref:olfactory receptor 4C3D-like n=1 Tax=Pelmatolapia mariae TaxID=158779 RepID=UPI002FE682F8